MNILGIHDGHNSSACILSSGKIIIAIQEERLQRIKNYWAIPVKTIQACLDYAGLKKQDLDCITVGTLNQTTKVNGYISKNHYMGYMKKLLDSDFSFREYLNIYRRRFLYYISKENYISGLKKQGEIIRREIYTNLFPNMAADKIYFIDHHMSHFATAAFGGKFFGRKKYLVFTCDGQGDGRCATVHLIDTDGSITLLSNIKDNHSVATLYAMVTAIMGFTVHEHEYKIMGMAPYAKRERSEEIGNMFLDLFIWNNGDWLIKPEINRMVDVYEKPLADKIKEIFKYNRFDDICGGIQYAFECILLKWISYYTDKYEIDTVALAGGAFMNVKANMLISELPQVKDMFVFPSCGDETIAIGAAMYQHFSLTNNPPAAIENVYWGKNYGSDEIEAALRSLELRGFRFDAKKVENIEREIAILLSNMGIVARFKGRSEFGARALGNRSILAHPSEHRNVIIINDMIKQRDFWMPFAASILDYRISDYLINPNNIESPFMIMAFRGGRKIDELCACSHPKDHSVRPQVVTKAANPSYYELLKHFEKITSIGGILNTSFNLHGYPLVETPEDALDVFFKSGLKYLALEDYMVIKNQS